VQLPPNPAKYCDLTFFGVKLGTYDIIAGGTAVIAGSFTFIAPIAYGAGAGATFPFAFTDNGFGCVGGGLVGGTVGKSFNFGPILGGTLSNYKNVLSGGSFSFNGQPNPTAGAQGIWNSNGTVYGPTFGSTGWSVSATYSFCGGG